tara:strand:+ start:118 stop:333 length:216 start_codon:yes stop_codon:yes gene_type:complete
MCVGPLAPPKPPKLPDPVEAAPMPEKTAKAPVVGQKRKSSPVRKGLNLRATKRTGTDSLRIPLSKGGNLNY